MKGFKVLFSRTTGKQRIVMGFCTVMIISLIGLGIYRLLPDEKPAPKIAKEEEQTVTVKTIQDNTKLLKDRLVNTPAEVKSVETQADKPIESHVVSNTTTVETPPVIEDYYFADDGGRYESEPTYSEPVEEPVDNSVEEPIDKPVESSGGNFDGNLGAVEATVTDDVEDYGTGISN